MPRPFLHAVAIVTLAFLASVTTTAIDRAKVKTPWSGNMFFQCPSTQVVTPSEWSPWRTYRHEWPTLSGEFSEEAVQQGGWE